MDSETKRKVQHMYKAEMKQLTKQECVDKFAELGYTLYDFNPYTNRGNEIVYQAVMTRIKETDTGISAFHYKKARRDANFEEMQKLRRWCFGVSRGRIIEL